MRPRSLAIAVALVLGFACPAAGATTHQVSIAGFAFHPTPVVIVAGDHVRWTNNDGSSHNIVSDTFASPSELLPGASFETALDAPGTYNYQCTLHNGMDGTVQVLAAPVATVPEAATPALLVLGAVAGLAAIGLGRRGRRSRLGPDGG